MYLGVVALNGKTCSKLFYRMIQIALLQVSDSKVFPDNGVSRVELKSTEVKGDSAFRITGLNEGQTQVSKHRIILRPNLSYILKERKRLFCATGTLESESELIFRIH